MSSSWRDSLSMYACRTLRRSALRATARHTPALYLVERHAAQLSLLLLDSRLEGARALTFQSLLVSLPPLEAPRAGLASHSR
eukprot:6185206-Pleurochrysis_carterae.AAC.3